MMQEFQYFEPQSVDEALSLLVKHGEAAKIIAGGTDLMLRMQRGTVRPQYVINVKAIQGLDYINCDTEIKIGATTTLRDIAKSTELRKNCPLIVEVTRKFAAIPIANMATLGGNLCNACPACDSGAPLIALSAGRRSVPVEQFFAGPGSTVMKKDEMLVEVRIPLPPVDAQWVYLKHVIRSATDLAIVSLSALVSIESGTFSRVGIALGAVSPTPMRASLAEDALVGQAADSESIERAALLVKKQCRPISDVRSTAEYRRHISYVLTKRALLGCLNSRIGEAA
jgi:CO/xanthine dehydrogenase FAD-binding subunit